MSEIVKLTHQSQAGSKGFSFRGQTRGRELELIFDPAEVSSLENQPHFVLEAGKKVTYAVPWCGMKDFELEVTACEADVPYIRDLFPQEVENGTIVRVSSLYYGNLGEEQKFFLVETRNSSLERKVWLARCSSGVDDAGGKILVERGFSADDYHLLPLPSGVFLLNIKENRVHLYALDGFGFQPPKEIFPPFGFNASWICSDSANPGEIVAVFESKGTNGVSTYGYYKILARLNSDFRPISAKFLDPGEVGNNGYSSHRNVAVSPDGKVFVMHNDDKHFDVYDRDLTLLARCELPKSKDGYFYMARSVTEKEVQIVMIDKPYSGEKSKRKEVAYKLRL